VEDKLVENDFLSAYISAYISAKPLPSLLKLSARKGAQRESRPCQ